LKTIHFKETIVSGNFLPWSSEICVFFLQNYLLQDGGSELFCSDDGPTPYTFFLKVPCVNKQLASLRKKYKVAGVKYGNYRAGRTSGRLFPLPIIENSGGNKSLAGGLAKKQVQLGHS
jgi:hypothetical protein